eukprot:1152336-Rhodomonas_salina.2
MGAPTKPRPEQATQCEQDREEESERERGAREEGREGGKGRRRERAVACNVDENEVAHSVEDVGDERDDDARLQNVLRLPPRKTKANNCQL